MWNCSVRAMRMECCITWCDVLWRPYLWCVYTIVQVRDTCTKSVYTVVPVRRTCTTNMPFHARASHMFVIHVRHTGITNMYGRSLWVGLVSRIWCNDDIIHFICNLLGLESRLSTHHWYLLTTRTQWRFIVIREVKDFHLYLGLDSRLNTGIYHQN